jgi:hypothetical protein
MYSKIKLNAPTIILTECDNQIQIVRHNLEEQGYITIDKKYVDDFIITDFIINNKHLLSAKLLDFLHTCDSIETFILKLHTYQKYEIAILYHFENFNNIYIIGLEENMFFIYGYINTLMSSQNNVIAIDLNCNNFKAKEFIFDYSFRVMSFVGETLYEIYTLFSEYSNKYLCKSPETLTTFNFDFLLQLGLNIEFDYYQKLLQLLNSKDVENNYLAQPLAISLGEDYIKLLVLYYANKLPYYNANEIYVDFCDMLINYAYNRFTIYTGVFYLVEYGCQSIDKIKKDLAKYF